ncbi:glutaminyl-peptide cyclotransferase [Salinimicrobium soli]|uniref:glutaminyl-peptide cyclotransferase n=1 Tax=Salinimicrobium soli TaxID=1254399 RepID=UPI003AAC7D89
MKIINSLSLLILSMLALSCGGDSEDTTSEYSLELNPNSTEFKLGDNLQVHLNASAGKKIDSVVYYLGNTRLEKTDKGDLNYTFQNEKLGRWPLRAKIYSNANMEQVEQEITLYNNVAPVTYTYEVINSYPHATDAYTQGLEFYNGQLYESTGHYGQSSLRKVDLETGEVLQSIEVPSNYFAEGITIINDKIYQLTWKEGVGFIYDVNSFEKLGEFAYHQSNEGWGLTHNENYMFKSDGTENIWLLDPETQAEKSFIQTVTNRTIATQLNELEWIDGKIYANTYQKNGVAIINPENGAIEGVINFDGLKERLNNASSLDPVNDVLNGIAYNSATGKLYVTGKNWDTLFEVEIKEK